VRPAEQHACSGEFESFFGGIISLMFFEASLLLATSSVFITTAPPRASMVNYTLRGPYICMLASFGLLIGGIIVASVCVLVSSKARPYWAEQVCAFCTHKPILKPALAGSICRPLPCVLHAYYAVLPIFRHWSWSSLPSLWYANPGCS
jgi:hypothetical protein